MYIEAILTITRIISAHVASYQNDSHFALK